MILSHGHQYFQVLDLAVTVPWSDEKHATPFNDLRVATRMLLERYGERADTLWAPPSALTIAQATVEYAEQQTLYTFAQSSMWRILLGLRVKQMALLPSRYVCVGRADSPCGALVRLEVL